MRSRPILDIYDHRNKPSTSRSQHLKLLATERSDSWQIRGEYKWYRWSNKRYRYFQVEEAKTTPYISYSTNTARSKVWAAVCLSLGRLLSVWLHYHATTYFKVNHND